MNEMARDLLHSVIQPELKMGETIRWCGRPVAKFSSEIKRILLNGMVWISIDVALLIFIGIDMLAFSIFGFFGILYLISIPLGRERGKVYVITNYRALILETQLNRKHIIESYTPPQLAPCIAGHFSHDDGNFAHDLIFERIKVEWDEYDTWENVGFLGLEETETPRKYLRELVLSQA